jgi:hypothetical protein
MTVAAVEGDLGNDGRRSSSGACAVGAPDDDDDDPGFSRRRCAVDQRGAALASCSRTPRDREWLSLGDKRPALVAVDDTDERDGSAGAVDVTAAMDEDREGTSCLAADDDEDDECAAFHAISFAGTLSWGDEGAEDAWFFPGICTGATEGSTEAGADTESRRGRDWDDK